jgi:hypothetical protein
MRGGDRNTGHCSVLELRGAGGQGPPTCGRSARSSILGWRRLSPEFEKLYAVGSAVDRVGEAAAGAVAASGLLGALGAAADGAAGLQFAVSLVWPAGCRSGM